MGITPPGKRGGPIEGSRKEHQTEKVGLVSHINEDKGGPTG